jgi:hypothetical protein
VNWERLHHSKRLCIAIWIIFIALVGTFFWPILRDPNHMLFAGTGDGWKNAFTFLYQIRYGRSIFWFRGMNYPFGEHIIFTDAQPLLAALLMGLRHLLPIEGVALGIHNLLLIVEIVLAALVTRALLRRLDATPFIASLGAVTTTLFSPQMMRFGGHYALAHLLPIPLTFYLATRWIQERRRCWLGWLALNSLLWGWIHPYFLLMTTALTLALVVFDGLLRRDRLRGIFLRAATQLIPIVIFQIVLRLTDPITDRALPVAGLNFASNWRGVFLANLVDLSHSIGSHGLDWISLPGFEGTAAVSVLGLPILALLAGLLIRRCLRSAPLNTQERLLAALLLSSVACLAVSFVNPDRVLPHGFLHGKLDLRQFRSLGRFAWIFAYGLGVLTFALWDRVRRTVPVLILALMTLQFAEAGLWFSRRLTVLEDGFSTFPVTGPLARVDLHRYQGVLALPYFHVGSEDERSFANESVVRASFALSLQTGLPSLGSDGSRASLSQTRLLVDGIRKGLELGRLEALLASDGRPVLMIRTDAPLSSAEEMLWTRGDPISGVDPANWRALDHIGPVTAAGAPKGDLRRQKSHTVSVSE